MPFLSQLGCGKVGDRRGRGGGCGHRMIESIDRSSICYGFNIPTAVGSPLPVMEKSVLRKPS